MTIAVSPVQVAPATRQALKALVETYYDAQKFRQRGYNRFWALRKELSDAERMLILFREFKEVEEAMAHEIAKVVENEPINDWLQGRRGVGPVMAAAIICSGLDPTIDKPSSWWRYAGVGVVDGHNQRLRRGQKRNYNGFLRRTLEVMVSQFLKAHQPQHDRPSYYAEWYYEFWRRSLRNRGLDQKAFEERTKELERELGNLEMADMLADADEDPDDTQKRKAKIAKARQKIYEHQALEQYVRGGGLQWIHHHRRAIMFTERIFLTHLQQKWREVLGLTPPRALYIVEKEPGVHEQIPAPD